MLRTPTCADLITSKHRRGTRNEQRLAVEQKTLDSAPADIKPAEQPELQHFNGSAPETRDQEFYVHM